MLYFCALLAILCLLIGTVHNQTVDDKSKSRGSDNVLFIRIYQPNLELYPSSGCVESIVLEHRKFKAASYVHWSCDHVEYAELFSKDPHYKKQPEDGVKYSPEQHYTFKLSNSVDISEIAFRFQVKPAGSSHVYYADLAAFNATYTVGYRNASLIDEFGNPRGILRADYLIVKPLPFKAQSNKRESVDIGAIQWAGHRGTGSGLRTDLTPNLWENTLDADNYACRNGARMIELDVHLSRDLIPIIFHDFVRPVSVQLKHGKTETINLDIKDYTAAEQEDMVYPGLDESFSLFETLESILDGLEDRCGINVEIKYPQANIDLSMEAELPVDINLYVDTILKTLLAKAGDRPIFISSFSADICTLFHMKQKRFDVYFLTSGNLESFKVPAPWLAYWDLRTLTVSANIAFAKSMNLAGLSLFSDHLYQVDIGDIKRIRDAGLGLAVWGDSLDTRAKALDLLKRGVQLLIVNHVDILNKRLIG